MVYLHNIMSNKYKFKINAYNWKRNKKYIFAIWEVRDVYYIISERKGSKCTEYNFINHYVKPFPKFDKSAPDDF